MWTEGLPCPQSERPRALGVKSNVGDLRQDLGPSKVNIYFSYPEYSDFVVRRNFTMSPLY